MCFEAPPTSGGEGRYYCYWPPTAGWAGLRAFPHWDWMRESREGGGGAWPVPAEGWGSCRTQPIRRERGRGLGIPEESMEILQRGGGEQRQHLQGPQLLAEELRAGGPQQHRADALSTQTPRYSQLRYGAAQALGQWLQLFHLQR